MANVHFIHRKYRESRGFSLLELIIAMAVMVVLVASAAPSFKNIIEANEVKRLATEIEWLLVQAKSEAVMRGKKIVIESKKIDKNMPNTAHDWEIEASVLGEATVIGRVTGEQFPNLKIVRTFDKSSFNFDPLTGRPSHAGRYHFSSDENVNVHVRTSNVTGRLLVCAEGGEYGYGQCPKD